MDIPSSMKWTSANTGQSPARPRAASYHLPMTGAGGTVDTAVGQPAAVLRPFLRRYLGYRYAGFQPGTHLGLPSPNLTVLVSLGDPTQVAVDGDRPPVGHTALAGGLHTKPVLLPHNGNQFGVQLDLTLAGGTCPVRATGCRHRAATIVGLDELLGPAGRELPDRMAAVPDWAHRFAVLDEVLARRTDRLEPAPMIHAGPPRPARPS
jgi:hypothetical protein